MQEGSIVCIKKSKLLTVNTWLKCNGFPPFTGEEQFLVTAIVPDADFAPYEGVQLFEYPDWLFGSDILDELLPPMDISIPEVEESLLTFVMSES